MNFININNLFLKKLQVLQISPTVVKRESLKLIQFLKILLNSALKIQKKKMKMFVWLLTMVMLLIEFS